MAKNIIFYFTGTGNSLKAAKDIASVLGDTELVFMKGNYELIGTYERIGFVFPCYAGGTPKAVMKFVRSLALSSTSADYLFAVVTCNESGANSLPMLHAELAKKDLALNYGEVLPVVGNYIVLYDLPNNQEQRLQTAERKTRDIADDIQRKGVKQIGKKRLPFSAFYAIGNQFFKAKEKQLCVSDACISCGLCEKICPVGNIQIENGKPLFLHKDCTNCFACVHWCPKRAIECGSVTVKRGRYHNPGVTVDEIITGRATII
jgi:ferredoxin/flavodoxin